MNRAEISSLRGQKLSHLALHKTNKTIIYHESDPLKSQHAGYTDDEIYIPLIVINTNEVE